MNLLVLALQELVDRSMLIKHMDVVIYDLFVGRKYILCVDLVSPMDKTASMPSSLVKSLDYLAHAVILLSAIVHQQY